MLRISVKQRPVFRADPCRWHYAPRNPPCSSMEIGLVVMLWANKIAVRHVSPTSKQRWSHPDRFRSCLRPAPVIHWNCYTVVITGVFSVAHLGDMRPWQHRGGFLHLFPKPPSGPPTGQAVHVCNVQSPRSFCYREWHLPALSLGSDWCLTSLILILLSPDLSADRVNEAGESKRQLWWWRPQSMLIDHKLHVTEHFWCCEMF